MPLVVRAIVPTNAEKLAVGLGDGHDVRKLDAGRLAAVIKVLVSLDIQIHVAFQQRDVGVQIGRLDTADLVHLLLDIRRIGLRCRNFDIAVETGNLLLAKLVLRYLYDVRYVFRRLQIRRRVRDEKLLRRYEPADRASQKFVIIDLLEGRTGQRQIKQHLIEFRRVLFHHAGNLVIHIVPDTLGLILGLGRYFPDYLRSNRPSRRKQLSKSLCLKLSHRLGQKRMGHARRTTERLRPVFVLEPEKLKPRPVSVFPFLAPALVGLILLQQFRRNSAGSTVVQQISQIVVEVLRLWTRRPWIEIHYDATIVLKLYIKTRCRDDRLIDNVNIDLRSFLKFHGRKGVPALDKGTCSKVAARERRTGHLICALMT